MNRKRTRTFVFALVAVLMAALWIGASADTSAAQGPGGRGWNGAAQDPDTTWQPRQGYRAQNQTQDPAANLGAETLQNQFGRGRGAVGAQQNFANLGLQLPAVPGEVPAEVVEALNAGWLDEYHAYQTYESIMLQFGRVAPFVNIQRAEAQHMAALEAMFARYDLDLPAPTATAAPSEFATLADACAAAVDAETANAALYDQWLAAVQNYPDLTQVFTALRDASLNQHLPAFERCAG